MAKPDQYFLGYSEAEQERLREQARQLAGESTSLFDQLGVSAGDRVVEIGCGPRGCLDLLSDRVGSTGSVVGVERSEDAVAMARSLIRDLGLANVEVLCRDARSTGLPREGFDVVTGRLVLVNVPEPEEILAEAVALVRPGGMVAFHEADWVLHMCDPPLEAWSRLMEVLGAYARLNGIDLFVGRRLPRMLRDAGLVDVRINPLVHVYAPDHGRRTIFVDFVGNLRERLSDQALIAADELNALIDTVRAHIDDPTTTVVSHLFIQAWGRKPE